MAGANGRNPRRSGRSSRRGRCDGSAPRRAGAAYPRRLGAARDDRDRVRDGRPHVPRGEHAARGATGATALAGHQAPPAWIDEFARAFCSGDAAFVSSHVSGELDIGEERIIDAFARRTWDCASSRYLGSATNTEGQHHVYVMTGTDNGEQWFVFTVVNDKVVGID